MGIANALCFANIGAAYGCSKWCSILTTGISKPEVIIKSVIPIIMAGIFVIYGLIVTVILNQNILYIVDGGICLMVYVVDYFL